MREDDLHVGGTPAGRYFDGALDFLHLAQGTLADADSTIEELYAWEFEGPFLRDFAGRKPTGARRDAGAIGSSDGVVFRARRSFLVVSGRFWSLLGGFLGFQLLG